MVSLCTFMLPIMNLVASNPKIIGFPSYYEIYLSHDPNSYSLALLTIYSAHNAYEINSPSNTNHYLSHGVLSQINGTPHPPLLPPTKMMLL